MHKAANFSSGVESVFKACINNSTSFPMKRKEDNHTEKKNIRKATLPLESKYKPLISHASNLFSGLMAA